MSSLIPIISRSESIPLPIWRRLSTRLLCHRKGVHKPGTEGRRIRTTIGFNGGYPLKGIVAHLSRFKPGALQPPDTLSVTASSVDPNQIGNSPQNAAVLSDASEFTSGDGVDEWICYDFKSGRVVPEHYTLAFPARRPGVNELSWALDGSRDGTTWSELDRRENEKPLTTMETYKISSPWKSRYIRLRMFSTDGERRVRLRLRALEIFGQFHELPVCTYLSTGQGYLVQSWWVCETCGLTAPSGCCRPCALHCHKGHKVRETGIVSSYCDCGTKEACKCAQFPGID